ncbi:MAG: DUF2442 domain-containing protein [Dehalococcoidia bacterium]|nr:DUF2442 domain-containing protein [Dehalococcoidia bacterium]
MTNLGQLVKVASVEPLTGFNVRVVFQDGTVKQLDLSSYLRGPIFRSIREDIETFRALTVENGVITWSNGADIDPDVLYYGLTPAWMEQAEEAGIASERQ